MTNYVEDTKAYVGPPANSLVPVSDPISHSQIDRTLDSHYDNMIANEEIQDRARDTLVNFYSTTNNASQLANVDNILAEYKGREEVIIAKIEGSVETAKGHSESNKVVEYTPRSRSHSIPEEYQPNHNGPSDPKPQYQDDVPIEKTETYHNSQPRSVTVETSQEEVIMQKLKMYEDLRNRGVITQAQYNDVTAGMQGYSGTSNYNHTNHYPSDVYLPGPPLPPAVEYRKEKPVAFDLPPPAKPQPSWTNSLFDCFQPVRFSAYS